MCVVSELKKGWILWKNQHLKSLWLWWGMLSGASYQIKQNVTYNIRVEYTINETKDVVTISKGYIATLAGQTKILTFHFADGYMTTFVVEVEGEVDTEQYDYVRDFSKDGIKALKRFPEMLTPAVSMRTENLRL